jgi:cell division protein FtsB
MSEKKKIKLGKIILIGFGAFLAIAFMQTLVGFVTLKMEKKNIVIEIEELREKNAKLSQKMKTVYEDKEYVEKVAREQLNLVKEGETVFIVK